MRDVGDKFLHAQGRRFSESA